MSKICSYVNRTDQWSTPSIIYNYILHCGYKDFNPLKEILLPGDDSFLQDFDDYFCNPPFSNISPFVDYMIENHRKGFKTLMLLPVRLNTDYFIKLWSYGVDILVVGRLKYGDVKSCAPFDSYFVKFVGGGVSTLNFIRSSNNSCILFDFINGV